MFEKLRFKIRKYKKEEFSTIECLDSKEREERFYLTILGYNGKIREFAIEPWAGDDIFHIADKLEKDTNITKAAIFSDYKNHVHYWKEFF